jgi:hypothetical protein
MVPRTSALIIALSIDETVSKRQSPSVVTMSAIQVIVRRSVAKMK